MVEIRRVLLVDLLLLVGGRIRTCDIETAVLHEVMIGVAAAGLAASGKPGFAVRER